MATLSGPWAMPTVREFLNDTAFPVRIACHGPGGFPKVVSLWFLHKEDSLYCVSHRNSYILKLLCENEKVGFEIAPNLPPYYGVRGQGVATLSTDDAGVTLEQLLNRYLGATTSTLAQWLLSRKDEEVLIKITPTKLTSWDYRERMSDVSD